MNNIESSKYALKHPGKNPDEYFTGRLNEKARNGEITCVDALEVAAEIKTDPAELGVNMDLIEMRITECQLGLFGFGEKKKTVKAAEKVNPDIRERIEKKLKNNRISCKEAWDIADESGISKMEIASVCEAMKVKIRPCQLGAFKQE